MCYCGDPFCDNEEDTPILGTSSEQGAAVHPTSALLGGMNSGMTAQSCSPAALVDMAMSQYALKNELFFASDSRKAKAKSPAFEPPGEFLTSFEDIDEKFSKYLFVTDGSVALYTIDYNGKGSFRVISGSRETAATLTRTLSEKYLEPEEVEAEDRVKLGFWHMTAHGPNRLVRSVDAPPLDELEQNYTSKTWKAFESLMTLEGLDSDAGRIILLHGQAGVGKTTALRGLARKWRKWANFDVVVDPEVMLSSASYLMSAVSAEHHSYTNEEDDEHESGSKWRVLIMEDSGELLRSDAKDVTGQGISRLLNMADGILGRGSKCIFVISTNEKLKSLHEAVTRPGRCLANIEFGPLSAEESSAWLGEEVNEEHTLANLYAKKNRDPVLKKSESFKRFTGQYL